MGFQQQILDHLFIAFITAIASLLIVIPSNFAGIYFPIIGCLLNTIGVLYLFFLLYKFYYLKKYQLIKSPALYYWWFYLSLSFAFTFSTPIIQRENWLSSHILAFSLLIPLLAYVLFELYSFRLGVKNWMDG